MDNGSLKLNHIYKGDCSRMEAISDGAVDFILSGPPYWNFINFRSFTQGRPYLWQGPESYKEFLKNLETWHTECFRVLRPGRFMVVNLANMQKGNVSYPIAFHGAGIFEKIGFQFCYEIIWNKVSGGRSRARNFVQNPLPGSFTPNIKTEYLLVYRKNPNVPFMKELKKGQRKKFQISLDRFFYREIANNIWNITPQKKCRFPAHPCPMPLEIPLRLISLFSLPEELVLDPFMGVGTTARAARALGRSYIGYELEAKFIDKANQLIQKPLVKSKGIIARYERFE